MGLLLLIFIAASSHILDAISASRVHINSLGRDQAAIIKCEHLNTRTNCSYSIESSGKICWLQPSDDDDYICGASKYSAKGMSGYIETDDCLLSCGVGGNAFEDEAASSMTDWADSLLQLCSPHCLNSCRGVVSFYTQLAHDRPKGFPYPQVCENGLAAYLVKLHETENA